MEHNRVNVLNFLSKATTVLKHSVKSSRGRQAGSFQFQPVQFYFDQF